jgi:hypothetical protein
MKTEERLWMEMRKEECEQKKEEEMAEKVEKER